MVILLMYQMLRMVASVKNHAKYEVLPVTRFVHTKGKRPAEICKEIMTVYGNIINPQNVGNGVVLPLVVGHIFIKT